MIVGILTGGLASGKTQTYLKLAGEKWLCFVPTPDNDNEDFAATPWADAKEFAQGLAAPREALAVANGGKLRLVMRLGESEEILKWFVDAGTSWEGWTFGFDDFPQLFVDVTDARNFAHFAAGIRHRHCKVLVTTQRIHGLVPPFVRIIADTVYQMGPMYAREEARALYQLNTGRDRNFNEFYARITQNKDYEAFPVRELAPKVHHDS